MYIVGTSNMTCVCTCIFPASLPLMLARAVHAKQCASVRLWIDLGCSSEQRTLTEDVILIN